MKRTNPWAIPHPTSPRAGRGAAATEAIKPALPAEKKKTYDKGEFGSTTEQRVYLALLQLGFSKDSIEAQVDLDGGRSRKGGQVVDFVLRTPMPVPIRVQGTYWHRDSGQEQLEEQAILKEYGAQVVDIWDTQALTVEMAVENLRRLIGGR